MDSQLKPIQHLTNTSRNYRIPHLNVVYMFSP